MSATTSPQYDTDRKGKKARNKNREEQEKSEDVNEREWMKKKFLQTFANYNQYQDKSNRKGNSSLFLHTLTLSFLSILS